MRCTPIGAELQQHYRSVLDLFIDGRVVPFLGAGANLCGRPPAYEWHPGDARCLPSGGELSRYLAKRFSCPEDGELGRVAQYVSMTNGSADLFHKLHQLFNRDYRPTSLHRFLAELPAMLRARGFAPRHQLIVTTNYDDVLERAFLEAGEPLDLVTYSSEGEARGKFVHTTPDGVETLVTIPNQYRDVSLERRSVLLKIHGAVNRQLPDGLGDSYVITEDHYIDYLTRTDLAHLMPVTLVAKLKNSHFLFLGYGLRDWNLRVMLHRIAGERNLSYKSWAIQREPPHLDQMFWKKRDVDILDVDLERYVAALRGRSRLLKAEAHV